MSKGEISDGYHTFNELYEHRNLLFLLLCCYEGSMTKWRPDYEGWFVLYYETDVGQISYHLPDKYLPIVERFAERDDNYAFDGHTPQDTLVRLKALAIRHLVFMDDFLNELKASVNHPVESQSTPGTDHHPAALE